MRGPYPAGNAVSSAARRPPYDRAVREPVCAVPSGQEPDARYPER
jgi:hypothetical protein